MDLDEYQRQKKEREAIERWENLTKELESRRRAIENLNVQISQLNGIIRNRDTEITRLKESHTAELNRQEDSYRAIINNLTEENKRLNELLAEREGDLEELTDRFDELRENVYDRINGIKADTSALVAKQDDMQVEVSNFKTLLNKNDAAVLTEVAKLIEAQRVGILSEITKINDAIPNQQNLIKAQVEAIINSAIEKINRHTEKEIEITFDYISDKIAEVKHALKQKEETEKIPAVATTTEPVQTDSKGTDKLTGLSEDAVKAYQAWKDPRTVAEIMTATGIGRSKAYEIKDILVDRGLIEQVKRLQGEKSDKFHVVETQESEG